MGLKRLICGVAFSYVPHVNKKNDGENKPACLDDFIRGDAEPTKEANPFWGRLGYPGPYCWGVGQEEDEKMIRKTKETFSASSRVEKHDEGNIASGSGSSGETNTEPFDFRKSGAMLDITENDTNLEFDCVIVGSGAGGSVAASILSSAGYSVLVLEKGPYIAQHETSQVESQSLDLMYEKHSLLTTSDGNISILAGSTLGGGTTINWSCCIETPAHVREEWVEKHNLFEFRKDGEFDTSLSSVVDRINARTDHVHHNGMNSKLIDGCNAMGYKWDVTKQNLKDTKIDTAGYICFGDRYGNKQSMMITYLKDAVKTGRCKIIDNCSVDRVMHETVHVNSATSRKGHRRAVGVTACIGSRKITVRAKRCVISCAGSLHTPCLLLRSKFQNPHIGRHLHLHPVVPAAGVYSTPIKGWLGAPMTVVLNKFQHGPLNDGYGAKIECPSLHPGLLGATCTWNNPQAYARTMIDAQNITAMIILQRDKGEGKVTVGEDGFSPCIDYELDAGDQASMMNALQGALKIHIASGASRIATGHAGDIGFDIDADESLSKILPPRDRVKSAQIKKYLQDVQNRGMTRLKMNVFCAHQMGSCRMGNSGPDHSVVDEHGEVWECDGLFVMDASTFPTASGANPMLTTLATSHMLSSRLAMRLQYEDEKLTSADGVGKMQGMMKARREKRGVKPKSYGGFLQSSNSLLVAGLVVIGAVAVHYFVS